MLGLARVPLSCLTFPADIAEGRRDEDDDNVDRLLRIYKLEGCDRAEERHFIKGYIDEPSQSGLVQEKPKNFSNLHPSSIPLIPLAISCTEGLHRVRAAEKFLDAQDKWWVVKVYNKQDASRQELRKDAQMFMNEQRFSDGFIMYSIICCRADKDKNSEQMWWARLTRTKEYYLRQILKRTAFARLFQKMRAWPGMFSPVMLGSFERLFSMKCDEELCNYLAHIIKSWESILAGTETSPTFLLEESSVRCLEGLVPGLSSADEATIRSAIQEGTCFAAASSQDKTRILANLENITYMVPSLHIFFESLKYLKPCTDIIRTLLPKKSKRTVREELFAVYRWRDQSYLPVEYALGDYRNHPSEGKLRDRLLCYEMLWLAVLRQVVELGNTTTRKERHERKPVATEPSPILNQELASYAFRLGFKTSIVSRRKDDNAAIAAAHQVLQSMGGPDDQDRDQIARDIAVLLKRRIVKSQPYAPHLTQESNLPVHRRYGRPFTDDYLSNQQVLFVPNIHMESPPKAVSISPFFCVSDVIKHFLGIEKTKHPFHILPGRPPSQGLETRLSQTPQNYAELRAALSRSQTALLESQQNAHKSADDLALKTLECTKLQQELYAFQQRVTTSHQQTSHEGAMSGSGVPPFIQRIRDYCRSHPVPQQSDFGNGLRVLYGENPEPTIEDFHVDSRQCEDFAKSVGLCTAEIFRNYDCYAGHKASLIIRRHNDEEGKEKDVTKIEENVAGVILTAWRKHAVIVLCHHHLERDFVQDKMPNQSSKLFALEKLRFVHEGELLLRKRFMIEDHPVDDDRRKIHLAGNDGQTPTTRHVGSSTGNTQGRQKQESRHKHPEEPSSSVARRQDVEMEEDDIL